MIEVPTSVRPLFVAAGWHPGRIVAPFPALQPDHPGATILAMFGGLTVGKTGAGEECATSDVAFEQLLTDDLSIFFWGKLLGAQLIGVVHVHLAHAELYVDGSGRCFTASIMDDGFCFEGASFGEAIERVLLSRRSRPLFRPGQTVVWHYGEKIKLDDPRVYRY